MDVYEIKKKSMEWFAADEEELWNDKLPYIHNYWIKSGLLVDPEAPGLITNPDIVNIEVEFEKPSPLLSRSEEIANVKAELDIGTMSIEAAIKTLHPDYSEDLVSEMIEAGMGINGVLKGMADTSEEGKVESNPLEA
jgi:hypothetical protein